MKRIISLILSLAMVSAFSLTAFAQNDEGELSLTCKAAVLMDPCTGTVLYSVDPEARLPEASITKVMTLLLVFEALDSGKIKLEDKVTCSAHAAGMGGSQIWLREGEVMTVGELIKAAAVGSANDASVALAEYIAGSHEAFVTMMNDRARQLGMKQTSYKNCTGLDAEGHLTSALDVAIVASELIKHEKIFDYSTIWMDSLRNGELQLNNTNKLLKQYDGITGLKTGTTSQAGCCICATAQRDGMELIAVILGAPNSKTRFAEAKKLLDYGFANWETVDAADYVPSMTDIEVKAGIERSVPVCAVMEGRLLIEKGSREKINVSVSCAENVTAPVEAGQTVGSVTLSADGRKLGEYPVVTCSSTGRVTFAAAFICLLKSMLSM